MTKPNRAFASMNGGRGPVRPRDPEVEAAKAARLAASPLGQIMAKVRGGEMTPDEGAEAVKAMQTENAQ